MARTYRWRRRIEPDKAFFFRRRVKIGDVVFGRGDRVPSTVPLSQLRRLFRSEKIVLRDDKPMDSSSIMSRLVMAISRLDPSNLMHWTQTGKPRVEVLEGMIGSDISGSERNAAYERWKQIHKEVA